MANWWGNNGNSKKLFSWAPKSLKMVTAVMKLRHLLLGGKSMTKIYSILKSRDNTLPTKVHLVKGMFFFFFFPLVMYGCENWTIKKAERQIIDTFQLWHWRKLLRVPWTTRRSNQSIQKISPEYSLEGLMLELKLQYFGHLMRRTISMEKTLMLRKTEGRKRRKKGGNRGRDGWMASPTQWTWVWVGSGSWWWTRKPSVLQFMGLQKVGHNWATDLNWTGYAQFLTQTF